MTFRAEAYGNIRGSQSKLSLRTPAEVILYLPEGRMPEEHQLIRLRTNKNAREFRAMSGSIANTAGTTGQDTVPFTTTRIAPRAYLVTLNSDLGAGEYGFYHTCPKQLETS